MSMFYKVIEKVDPKNPQGEKMYGAQTVYKTELKFEELCQNISLRCSMTDSDIEAVLQAFITNATLLVMNSRNVELGKLGYLTAALKTDMVEDPEQYDKSNIRGMRIVFVPSSTLRNELMKVTYTKVSTAKPAEE